MKIGDLVKDRNDNVGLITKTGKAGLTGKSQKYWWVEWLVPDRNTPKRSHTVDQRFLEVV